MTKSNKEGTLLHTLKPQNGYYKDPSNMVRFDGGWKCIGGIACFYPSFGSDVDGLVDLYYYPEGTTRTPQLSLYVNAKTGEQKFYALIDIETTTVDKNNFYFTDVFYHPLKLKVANPITIQDIKRLVIRVDFNVTENTFPVIMYATKTSTDTYVYHIRTIEVYQL